MGVDDAEYWSGNYGTVIDNSVVSVAEVHNVGICSGTYTFNNQTLSSSGTYTGSFTGSYGCDSNVVLNLHIGPYNIDDTFNLCEGDTFMYNSQPYTTSTTISGQFASAAGCDSNILYTLDFIELFDDTIWASICPGEFYQFGSLTLFSSGTYTDQFTSQYGCDSNVVLVLSESPAQFESHIGYICENGNYTFGDTTLTAPGGYFRIFQNSSGCDSIVNLTLVQDLDHDTSIAMNLCLNDTLFFGSQVITETGSYQETFFTLRGGCDSLVSLDVTAIEIDRGVDVADTELKAGEDGTGTTYQWLDCKQNMSPILGATSQTYTPNDGGKYAVEITKNFCTDTSDCKTFWPLGLNELGQNEIVLYPNPVDDHINIQSNKGLTIEAVTIRDMTGRLFFTTKLIAGNTAKIDVSAIPKGTYILSISNEQEVFRQTLVKM
ncbi:T9SS type A sorting domain-containing protein [Salibacteraceae bacterium]|nr:T9SS type A sorting domain-containing protein [Salibacteraceae bacterium]